MTLHLQEIAVAVAPGAHAVLFVDRAGSHVTAKLGVPENMRVLTKDSPENRSFFGEGVKVVVEVMVDPQRQIDHFDDLGDDFRTAAEPREKVADVAEIGRAHV